MMINHLCYKVASTCMSGLCYLFPPVYTCDHDLTPSSSYTVEVYSLQWLKIYI